MRVLFALGVLGLLAACPRDLTLPPPTVGPRITGFEPTAAFGGDILYVYGENFDVSGNQLEFPGGLTVLAQGTDAGDTRTNGALSFVVPPRIAYNAPLLLSNTRGRSEPSGKQFVALGTGHPDDGTPVAQLRFRHNPVGLVDQEENVLMGSSIFDLVVTDGKAFSKVPGRPVALKRSPRDVGSDGRALLSVSLPGRRGRFLEVKTLNGEEVSTSAPSEHRELFILPPFDPTIAIARTIGVSDRGKYSFATWTVQGPALNVTRRDLPFSEVIGAAALGSLVAVVARNSLDLNYAVWTVSSLGEAQVWTPMTGSGCNTSAAMPSPPTLCESPDGPITVVPPVTMGDPPLVVASLRSGDLLVLSGTSATAIKLISYATINALSPTTTPGKVLITKGVDGALFQYDLPTQEVDWSVQLRGEPSVIDVAPAIDEIAVGNKFDNAVDIIQASTGTWTGRVAFNLGVGSTNGLQGGIVAPYSYNPDDYDGGYASLQRMDLLMRNVGLVVSIDASSLEIIDHLVLDKNGGLPLRLAVTHDFETLVLHTDAVGVLEPESPDTQQRLERVVTEPLGKVPLDFFVLPNGQVVISFLDSVRWYQWDDEEDRGLSPAGELQLPAGARLLSAVADGDDVLVSWTVSPGVFGGGTYGLSGSTPIQRSSIDLPRSITEFVGMVAMRDGPAGFFMQQDTPVTLQGEDWLTGAEPTVASVINRKRVSGTTPDGRFVVWLDEGSAEPMARLVSKGDDGSWYGYSTYRLAGHAAGPACDPSGQWLYLPVPLLDQLEVVK